MRWPRRKRLGRILCWKHTGLLYEAAFGSLLDLTGRMYVRRSKAVFEASRECPKCLELREKSRQRTGGNRPCEAYSRPRYDVSTVQCGLPYGHGGDFHAGPADGSMSWVWPMPHAAQYQATYVDLMAIVRGQEGWPPPLVEEP